MPHPRRHAFRRATLDAGPPLDARPPPPERAIRTAAVLGWIAAGLAALSSAIALLVPGVYHRDPAVLVPQLLGQDAVTLALAAPALAASAWLARRGSRRATILTAGLLLYMAYTYATYALGARFNPLFLAYCAILGTSTYALFVLVPRLGDVEPGPSEWARLPRRSLVVLLYSIVLVFTWLWGSDILPALLQGGTPAAALEAQTPTSMIHVLDLAFLLPLGAVAATLLARRRPWGVHLAGVFLVKGVTIALAVLSMAGFAYAGGQPVNVPVGVAMLATLVLLALAGWRYARALAPPRGPQPALPAAGGPVP